MAKLTVNYDEYSSLDKLINALKNQEEQGASVQMVSDYYQDYGDGESVKDMHMVQSSQKAIDCQDARHALEKVKLQRSMTIEGDDIEADISPIQLIALKNAQQYIEQLELGLSDRSLSKAYNAIVAKIEKAIAPEAKMNAVNVNERFDPSKGEKIDIGLS